MFQFISFQNPIWKRKPLFFLGVSKTNYLDLPWDLDRERDLDLLEE